MTKYGKGFFCGLCLVSITSCSNLPANSIAVSHLEYNDHLRSSARSQLLTNVIGLQYHDAPYFLTATSVVSQLSRESSISAELAIRPPTDDAAGTLGGSLTFTESPTISYTPLQGESYARLLLTPLPPALILALAESGWPVDLLLQLSVRSINGIQNDHEQGAQFFELTQLLRMMQLNHELTIHIQRDNSEYQATFLLNPKLNDAAQQRLFMLRNQLGLTGEIPASFHIHFKFFPTEANELAIVTRSMLDVLTMLGQGVTKKTIASQSPRLNIERSQQPPIHAYASARYRDHYYWIGIHDYQSQQLFMLTQLLYELTSTTEQNISPVLSISSS
ncbi:hypothetical protein [Alkalimonas mucilaginosa]|uniref:Uncharacterized protein n=1 Tax=Alkalimonas mucilaginosa TaxID=3057676 RepID=A0ABU7JJG9_9GAMM|nr:hypothetical protein [Alkalimonas sp. MEB004]MEE2025849.1 hypothetical protein [Alkalimonas sp. MEB004]